MNSIFTRQASSSPNSYPLHAIGASVFIGAILLCLYCHRLVTNNALDLDNTRSRLLKLASLSDSIESRTSIAKQRATDSAKQLTAIESRLPKRLIDSEVISGIHTIVADSQCDLVDFRPIGTQDTVIGSASCKVRAYQIRATGTFPAAYKFVESVDKLPQKCFVKKCRIGQARDGLCNIDIDLAACFDLHWSLESRNKP